MIVLLQALLRLIFVALAAVGTWAGVHLDLPGAPSDEERTAAATEVREHSLDVAARIGEAGLGTLPAAIEPALPTTTVLAPVIGSLVPAPVVSPEPVVVPRPAPVPVPVPAPTPIVIPAPAPEPEPEPIEEPAPTWIETKLPESLYDPVEGAADEAAAKNDDESLARQTTVNIACLRRDGLATHVSAGSGVVVSPDGLVATNAHVAYHFLLEEDGVECSITHPSFPIFGYPAQLVYISPDWVEENENVIGGGGGSASGEEDYAFVSFSPGILGALAYAPISLAEPVAEFGDEIVVAGFPGAAASLEGYGASSRLKVDEVDVEDTDSFDRSTADIIQTSRTDVAGAGSSGGGAFKDGELVGLTVTVYPLGSGYGINALSTAWINRDLRRDAGVSIDDLLREDYADAAASFWASDGETLADLVRRAQD